MSEDICVTFDKLQQKSWEKIQEKYPGFNFWLPNQNEGFPFYNSWLEDYNKMMKLSDEIAKTKGCDGNEYWDIKFKYISKWSEKLA